MYSFIVLRFLSVFDEQLIFLCLQKRQKQIEFGKSKVVALHMMDNRETDERQELFSVCIVKIILQLPSSTFYVLSKTHKMFNLRIEIAPAMHFSNIHYSAGGMKTLLFSATIIFSY